ncbi:MAG: STAS domain-containing protein [Pseudomonadota bacterium]
MPATEVKLPTSFKIDAVADVAAQLADVFESEEAVEVNGAAVEAVDFAGLQLLAVFRRARQEANRACLVTAPSDTLSAAMNDTGLTVEAAEDE